MFLRHTIKVKLEAPQRFMEGAVLTANNTVVVFSHDLKESLVWCFNEAGKLIKRYQEGSVVLHFGCLVGREVMYLLPKSQQIGWLDIETQQRSYSPFGYLSDSLYGQKLWLFQQSLHYCIQERSSDGKSHRLTFLKHPSTIVYSTTVQNSEQYTFQPINHTGSIAYYSKSRPHFQINIVDCLEKSTKTFVFRKPEGTANKIILRSVQQLTNDQLLLVCDDCNLNYRCMVYNLIDDKLRQFGSAQHKPPVSIYDVKVCGAFICFYCCSSEKKPLISTAGLLYIFTRESQQRVTHLPCTIHSEYHYTTNQLAGSNLLIQQVFRHNQSNELTLNIQKICSQQQLYISLIKQLGQFSHEMIQHIIDAFAADDETN